MFSSTFAHKLHVTGIIVTPLKPLRGCRRQASGEKPCVRCQPPRRARKAVKSASGPAAGGADTPHLSVKPERARACGPQSA